MDDNKHKPDEYWRSKLTPEQYHVTVEKGTEAAFTGKYDNFFEQGMYACIRCGKELFASEAKFDSGCGWPAFSAPVENAAVSETDDQSHGMRRTEVLCSECNAHLGHVFTDDPGSTHQRYCINAAALKFHEKDQ